MMPEGLSWSQGSWMFKMFILFEVKVSNHKITGVDRGLQKIDMFGAKVFVKEWSSSHLKLVARNLGARVCHVEGCV